MAGLRALTCYLPTKVLAVQILCALTLCLSGCDDTPPPDLGDPQTATQGNSPTPLPATPTPVPATATMDPSTPTDVPTATPSEPCLDSDGDGYDCDEDCDDSNPAIYPGRVEVCDGKDDNCNGIVDDVDADSDGWYGCSGSSGTVDCDDNNAAVWPGNFEACDGFDNDCDGLTDEGYDQDGDGYVSCGVGALADCNDADGTQNPGAAEVCNGKDDNCNGTTDEGVKGIYYPDQDGDGYGAITGGSESCSPPSGFVSESGDCDDSNGNTYPGATELCDGIDNNCNGSLSDESPQSTFYFDQDGDGYGGDASLQACLGPDGYVEQGGDCDDFEAQVHPGATETCDTEDNDCDGTADEGLGSTTFHVDADGDGYGDPDNTIVTCDSCLGNGCSLDDTDCDDGDATTYPGAEEIPDGKDNNCDGEAESALSLDTVSATISSTTSGAALGASISALGDVDGDGYGDFAIGAPKGGPARGGQVFIFYGGPNGLGHVSDNSAGTHFYMEQQGADFGTSISGLDLDANGVADIAIGAPFYDSGVLVDSGIVFTVYSESGVRPTSGPLGTNDPRTSYVIGLAGQVYLGSALDGFGDINGDGYSDLLVGAPWPWVSQIPPLGGIAMGLMGKVGKYQTAGGVNANNLVQIYGESGQILGLNVVHTGDTDGNGYGDFLAVGYGAEGRGSSAYDNNGITYVIGGGDSSRFPPGVTATLNASDLSISTYKGDSQGDLVGKWAAGLGDVNGDGFSDFILGRQAAKSGEPLAMLYLGGPLPPSGNAEAAADVRFTASDTHCPCSVGSIGDYNGDGYGDFAIAAPNSAAGGAIYLFYGSAGEWPATVSLEDADLTLFASTSGDLAGTAIAPIGDVNGDGKDDFALGAPGADPGGVSNGGAVYIFYGE